MKKFKGYELDEDMNIIGQGEFVSFGEMSDGTKCYHKVVDGNEIEGVWYSCFMYNGNRMFALEGIN